MALDGFAPDNIGLSIREARSDDAGAACQIVRDSIVELCFLDHGGDRGVLAAWLANKTPDNVRLWIAGSHVFVAEREGTIVGVAALTRSGELTLNYVAPAHRFTGVSRALLLAAEERARDLGLDHCSLDTTQTALAFYRAAGYRDAESPQRTTRLLKRL